MKRVVVCVFAALMSFPLFAQFSTSSGNTTTSDKVGIGTTAPGANLDIGTGASSTRFLLSGAEFFVSSNTSTDGVGFLLGVNRSQNRQLWLVDSSRSSASSSNPALRLGIFSDYTMIDSIGTDVTTKKLLVVGNAGNVELATGGGKVGIGTNAPTSMLHLKSTTGQIDLTLDGSTASGARVLQPNAAPLAFTIAGSTGDFTFNGGSPTTERVRIQGGGNVGIGTSAPATLLHVSGVSRGISPYVMIERGTTLGDAGLVFRTNGIGTSQWLIGKAGALSSEDLSIGYGDFAASNSRLLLATGGNVGIGRTTPVAKLDVNGAIRGNSHMAFLPWTNVAPTAATGYVRLLTPVADQEGNFFSFHILGYRYNTTATVAQSIDIRCSGFAQAGVGLTGPTCTAVGTDLPVQLATESSYVVVRIGKTTSSWYYDHFSVEYDGWLAKDPAGFVWSTAATATVTNMNNVAIRNDGGGVIEIGQPPANSTTGPFDQTLRLSVHGSAVIDGNIAAKYQDVAEWVPVATKLTPGTVVVISPEKRNEVMASTRAYDTSIAGVVSTQPGLILGEAGESKAQIATTGRVKVHVDATKHSVRAGDLLVSGEKPGTAMFSEAVEVAGIKLHRPGTLIGKALEPLASGEGDILVLLSLQ